MTNKKKNDEIFFQNNGYLIKKINDINSYKYLFNRFKKFLLSSDHFSKINFDLNKLHKNLNKKKLNNLRLTIIKKINEDNKFNQCYYNVAKETLDLLIGNELAMQKNINLSIQTPKDKNSMLSMHSDIHAGESPFEVVVWIPLTDVRSNSMSMFIASPNDNKKINKTLINSKKNINQIYLKNKKKFKFINIKAGEILVFSPILLHGNVVNNTDFTRISMNCRFKSLLSPYNVFSKTHRNIPHFFKPLTIKPMTKIGFNFIQNYNEKK